MTNQVLGNFQQEIGKLKYWKNLGRHSWSEKFAATRRYSASKCGKSYLLVLFLPLPHSLSSTYIARPLCFCIAASIPSKLDSRFNLFSVMSLSVVEGTYSRL